MTDWKCVLQLNSARFISAGSETALRDAVRGGADLRIYPQVRHNVHVGFISTNMWLLARGRAAVELCT
jgi:hypothetical protein